MAIKKSDLYSSLWETANDLRGWMDASSYKDYVLVILFVKYVSDKYEWKPYADFVIPEGWSFKDMVRAKNQKDIWETINKVIAKIAEANDLKWVIDKTDFDDSDKLGKWSEKVEKLSKLIAVFENENLDFSNNRAEWDDILGDVYEYFMKNFASEAGKSKWQFYTPAEVSRIMAKIIGVANANTPDKTAYDMACWSGSLLLKVWAEANADITLYWQEKDIAVSVLAKMNMILHGKPTAEIATWNTLTDPQFKKNDGTLQTFDYCVANPPFSDKGWMNGMWNPENDEFHRFDYGTPPAKNGDYAFLSHMLKSMKQTGKWAIILPHGVLFRWNAEADIRREIIKHWYIKWIIWLPANLFFWTWIPAAIIILDKEWAANREWIFMIEASKWYIKDGNKNRLRAQDIHKIVTTFTNEIELPKYSRMVPMKEIEANEYNLNIPRYIDTQEEEDIQDIKAHIQWWIPASDLDKFDAYRKVFPTLKSCLFEAIDTSYYSCKVEEDKIQETINNNSEFKDYTNHASAILKKWIEDNKPTLLSISSDTKAKEFVSELAETILYAYKPDQLIEEYDVYQHLMDYVDEVMQDDIYLIVEWGWNAEVAIDIDSKWKNKWRHCDLLPKEIIVNAYFSEDKEELERLNSERDELTSSLESLIEENSWADEDWNDRVLTAWEDEKVNLAFVKAKQKEDWLSDDDKKVLKEYIRINDEISAKNKEIKELDAKIDTEAFEKYSELTEDDVKDLVVNKKWLVRIASDVETEQEKVAQTLTQWVKTLLERYNRTLWDIENDVKSYEEKVNEHLRKMWFSL